MKRPLLCCKGWRLGLEANGQAFNLLVALWATKIEPFTRKQGPGQADGDLHNDAVVGGDAAAVVGDAAAAVGDAAAAGDGGGAGAEAEGAARAPGSADHPPSLQASSAASSRLMLPPLACRLKTRIFELDT